MRRVLLFMLRLLTIIGIAEVFRESQFQTTEPEVAPNGNSDSTASSAGEDRRGWSTPRPECTPRPTYWPAVVALGVMFFCWGIISNLIVLMLGVLLLLTGITGWIGDLLSEG